MGLVVLVLEPDPVPPIDPSVAARLAGVGVTSVALLGDARTTAIVVEGWAFDHRTSGREVADAIAPGRTDIRVLSPLLQTAIEMPAGEIRGEEDR